MHKDKSLRIINNKRDIETKKSISKDKLLRIINNKRDRKTKKSIHKTMRNSFFKSKRKKNKNKTPQTSEKGLFQSKIKEIIKLLYDTKIKRDR